MDDTDSSSDADDGDDDDGVEITYNLGEEGSYVEMTWWMRAGVPRGDNLEEISEASTFDVDKVFFRISTIKLTFPCSVRDSLLILLVFLL